MWYHDEIVIKRKHFPSYWPFVRDIYWSPVNAPHKGQWHGALMFSLICTWTNDWANTQDTGDLRHHHAQYNVTVMISMLNCTWNNIVWEITEKMATCCFTKLIYFLWRQPMLNPFFQWMAMIIQFSMVYSVCSHSFQVVLTIIIREIWQLCRRSNYKFNHYQRPF